MHNCTTTRVVSLGGGEQAGGGEEELEAFAGGSLTSDKGDIPTPLPELVDIDAYFRLQVQVQADLLPPPSTYFASAGDGPGRHDGLSDRYTCCRRRRTWLEMSRTVPVLTLVIRCDSARRGQHESRSCTSRKSASELVSVCLALRGASSALLPA